MTWDFAFQQALDRKYGIQQQEADSRGNLANAQAGAARQMAANDAQRVRNEDPMLNGMLGLRQAQTGLTGAQATGQDILNQPNQWLSDQFGFNTHQNLLPGFHDGSADVPASDELLGMYHDHHAGHTQAPAHYANRRYDDGTGKIPGKDVGRDTVPAVLRPGEAVLVPGAADEIGRDKIAALNAKHNAVGTPVQGGGSLEKNPQKDAKPQGSPQKPAGKKETAPAPKASPKGEKPASKQPSKPSPSKSGKPQELSKGTHMVKAGKSAATPKINAGALQALAGMLGQGGPGMPGGSPQMSQNAVPPQGLCRGGMV